MNRKTRKPNYTPHQDPDRHHRLHRVGDPAGHVADGGLADRHHPRQHHLPADRPMADHTVRPTRIRLHASRQSNKTNKGKQ
mgnify:CR=1 FL=1